MQKLQPIIKDEKLAIFIIGADDGITGKLLKEN